MRRRARPGGWTRARLLAGARGASCKAHARGPKRGWGPPRACHRPAPRPAEGARASASKALSSPGKASPESPPVTHTHTHTHKRPSFCVLRQGSDNMAKSEGGGWGRPRGARSSARLGPGSACGRALFRSLSSTLCRHPSSRPSGTQPISDTQGGSTKALGGRVGGPARKRIGPPRAILAEFWFGPCLAESSPKLVESLS